MKVNIITWNVRGLNNTENRNLSRTALQKWKADFYCFQETKINKNVEEVAKSL